MGRPNLLLLDEPSMGLAPIVVENIFEVLAKLSRDGLTMLMVEQNAEMALFLADEVAVMETGSIVLTGTPTDVWELMDLFAGNGGLIIEGSIGVADEAKRENVFTLREAVDEHGA